MEAMASAAEWFVKDITRGGLSRESARDMDDLLLNAGNISNRLKVTASRSGGKAEFGSETPQADVDPRDKNFEKLKTMKGVTYQGRGFYIIPAKLLEGSNGILRYREVKQPTNRFQLTAMGDLVGWGTGHPQQNDYRLKDWQEAFPKAAMSRIGGKATFGSDVILEDIGDDQVRATARVEGRSAGSFDGPRSQSAQLLLKALKIAGQGHEVSSGVYDMTHITLNDAAKRAMPKSAMMSRGGKAEFAMEVGDTVKVKQGGKTVSGKIIKLPNATDLENGQYLIELPNQLYNDGRVTRELVPANRILMSRARFGHANQQIADGVAQLLSVLGFAEMAAEAKTTTDSETLKRYINVARSRFKGTDQADRVKVLTDKLERMLMSRGRKGEFAMDQTTHRHLLEWIGGKLGSRAGSAGYIADKMVEAFNDDPDYWAEKGWSKVFDAAGLSLADLNNPKKGWD
jgi:hypothetical protein